MDLIEKEEICIDEESIDISEIVHIKSKEENEIEGI